MRSTGQSHLIQLADPIEIVVSTKRGQVDIIFKFQNREQMSPRHRPSFVEFIQICRLIAASRSLLYV